MTKPTRKDLRSMGRQLRMMAMAEMDQRSDRMPASEGHGPGEREFGEHPLEDYPLPSVVFL
jgi:hypothetical protein